MANTIRFSQGKRFQVSSFECPNCKSLLYLDTMAAHLVCLKCNYIEERKLEKDETISSNFQST